MIERAKNSLLKDVIEDEAEREIVEYGFQQGLILALNIICFLAVSIILNAIKHGIVFLFLFWPLRIYAGGYHADTRKRCFLLSIAAEVIVLLCMSRGNISIETMAFFSALSVGITLILAPLGNTNKELTNEEFVYYKKYVKKILAANITTFVIAYVFQNHIVIKGVCFSTLLTAILLILGKIKNNKEKEEIDI